MWKAFIRADDYGFGVSLFLGTSRGVKEPVTARLVQPVSGFTIEERTPGATVETPFMEGEMAEGIIQAILDAAWAHGMRPSGISGERGEIARLEAHLDDMRKVGDRFSQLFDRTLPGVK